MFVQALAIAIGAGLASALLFVVAAKGTMLAALLTAFAPLPIMIAALGWTHWAGLLAGLVGALAISLFLPAPPAILFALVLALPGWQLARLALLADPPLDAPDSAPEATRSWYPIQRLAAWGVVAGMAIACGWIVMLMVTTQSGFDFDRAAASAGDRLATAIETIVGRGAFPQGVTPSDFARAMIRVMPPAAAASMTAMMLTNLWIAGRIVEVSGRALRPRPNIPREFALPRFFLGALAGALVLAFAPGLIGMIGWVTTAAVAVAFAMQGLATIHVLTRDWSQRRTALLGLYLIVLFFAWSLAVIALIGVADALFGLRQRSLSQSPPTQT